MLDINKKYKNMARGSEHYRPLRWRIANDLLNHNGPEIAPLSDFLAESLYEIDDHVWINLAFTDRDWKVLERIRAKSKYLDSSYLNMCLDYINANSKRIKSLYEKEKEISNALLLISAEEADRMVSLFDRKDMQSLYMYRILSALYNKDQEQLLNVFEGKSYSEWFRKRFLYPFVFYYVNLPQDKFLDLHLSYAMPPGQENKIERSVIEFLLRDELCYKEPLAFKCYISLLCHPFDACEFLINHCELVFSRDGKLGALEHRIVKSLVGIVPDWRIHSAGGLSAVNHNPTEEPELGHALFLDNTSEQWKKFSSAFLSLDKFTFDDTSLPGAILPVLCRIRAAQYPRVLDYDIAVTHARAYSFTCAGRLVGALLTSLFLMPRREVEYERRDWYRLVAFAGGITAFIATAPRGFQICHSILPIQFIRDVDNKTGVAGSFTDRAWMNATHWPLSALEHEGKLSNWMDLIKDRIPIAPSYLTGIDWEGFAETMQVVRITPFLGSVSGIYVLLLQFIEERSKEATALRVAIEPIAKGSPNISDFVVWLGDNYGEGAIAFVRFALSADMLLYLDIDTNYTAALTHRMSAIESCAKRFGLTTPYLSEEELISEQKAYTTALLAISIGANQFAVSWDIFKKDVALKHGDIFKAYLAFKDENDGSTLLTLGKKEIPYRFSNGRTEVYQIINKDWPLLNVYFGIIDTFLEHPTQGIEAILAIRIRHHCLKREFNQPFENLLAIRMPDLTMADRSFFVPRFKTPVLKVVQEWIDKYMHLKDSQYESAAFDFVPTQLDVQTFLDRCTQKNGLDDVLSVAEGYLSDRLHAQLEVSQQLLGSELRQAIENTFSETQANLIKEFGDYECISVIGTALRNSINREIDRLLEWFSPTFTADVAVELSDLWLAVRERYQPDIARNALKLGRFPRVPTINFEKDKARLMFDLMCEAIQNAMNHSGSLPPDIHVRAIRTMDGAALNFISHSDDPPSSSIKTGHPYLSVSDALFREGDSGLTKIASLAASFLGNETNVKGILRSDRFHLIVPVSKVGAL